MNAITMTGAAARRSVSSACPPRCCSDSSPRCRFRSRWPDPADRDARVLGRDARPGPHAAGRSALFRLLPAYGALTLVASAFSIDPIEQLHRQQTARAVRDRAGGLRHRPRSARRHGRRRHHLGRRGQRASSASCSTACCTTTTSASVPRARSTHYMTYSGVADAGHLCAAAARLVFGSRDRTWPALVMPALVVALALTFTRNAWIGACVGGRSAVRAEGLPADGAAAGHRRGAVRHGASRDS